MLAFAGHPYSSSPPIFLHCLWVERSFARVNYLTQWLLSQLLTNTIHLSLQNKQYSPYCLLYFALQANNLPDSRIYVWDIELDAFQSFDFATGHGTGADEGDKESPDIMNRAQQAAEIAGRRPLAQFWDPTEPKLLVCEAVHIPGMLQETSNSKSSTRKPANMTAADLSREVKLLIIVKSFLHNVYIIIYEPQK